MGQHRARTAGVPLRDGISIAANRLGHLGIASRSPWFASCRRARGVIRFVPAEGGTSEDALAPSDAESPLCRTVPRR